MKQGIWRSSPALVVAALALFVALGGSVYAAKKAKIDGRAIKAKSIPGNRVKPRSLAANRLRPGVMRSLRNAARHRGPQLTGAEINELTLGQVPEAVHAETADTAQSAVDAQTSLNAVNAIDAKTVNGHGAGCLPGTKPFAGACWQSSASTEKDAPTAARDCAIQGGELPDALQLAAFANQPGVNLASEGEWSGEIVSYTDKGTYAVATVSPDGFIDAGSINEAGVSETRAYRCVIPLVR